MLTEEVSLSPVVAHQARPVQNERRQEVSRSQRRQGRTYRYDPEMIHNFLTQLVWELRICHFEQVNPGVINEELVDQMKGFLKKYGTSLLYSIHVTGTEEQVAEIHRKRSRNLQQQIDALELLLRTVFPEALRCASPKFAHGVETHVRCKAAHYLLLLDEHYRAEGGEAKP
jgi:hypothetical protein